MKFAHWIFIFPHWCQFWELPEINFKKKSSYIYIKRGKEKEKMRKLNEIKVWWANKIIIYPFIYIGNISFSVLKVAYINDIIKIVKFKYKVI